MSIDKNNLFISLMFLMSNILLTLVDVDAAARLARQQTAIQVIVMLVTIIFNSSDDHIIGSFGTIVDEL